MNVLLVICGGVAFQNSGNGLPGIGPGGKSNGVSQYIRDPAAPADIEEVGTTRLRDGDCCSSPGFAIPEFFGDRRGSTVPGSTEGSGPGAGNYSVL